MSSLLARGMVARVGVCTRFLTHLPPTLDLSELISQQHNQQYPCCGRMLSVPRFVSRPKQAKQDLVLFHAILKEPLRRSFLWLHQQLTCNFCRLTMRFSLHSVASMHCCTVQVLRCRFPHVELSPLPHRCPPRDQKPLVEQSMCASRISQQLDLRPRCGSVVFVARTTLTAVWTARVAALRARQLPFHRPLM